MCNIARDSDNRQLPVQQWNVIATENVTLYLTFEKNCFRKHFLLPSKKGVSPEQKALNKAETRFLATGYARKLDQSIKPSGSEQRRIEKRYGMGSDTSRVVDLNIMSLKEVLVELGKSLLNHNWSISDEVQITFSRPCVRKLTAEAAPGADVITTACGAPTTDITFKVVKESATNYTFSHCLST